jgi:hypothetical protein
MYKINFTSADEMGRKIVKITWTRRPGREPEGRLCCIAFVFHDSIPIYQLYKLSISDQDQFSVQLRINLSD